MNNAQVNTEFLESIDTRTKVAILKNIAKHYGISPLEAYVDVTSEGAEHLTDYITGPDRFEISFLMNH